MMIRDSGILNRECGYLHSGMKIPECEDVNSGMQIPECKDLNSGMKILVLYLKVHPERIIPIPDLALNIAPLFVEKLLV